MPFWRAVRVLRDEKLEDHADLVPAEHSQFGVSLDVGDCPSMLTLP